MPAAGGDGTQVTRGGGATVVASPDGQWLYYRLVSGFVRRIHPDGTGDSAVLNETVPVLTFTATSSRFMVRVATECPTTVLVASNCCAMARKRPVRS